MPKQVSLKKIWHLCNTAIKNNYAPGDVSSAIQAYSLLPNCKTDKIQTLLNKFGASISESHFENVCLEIESLLNLPIKDGDFLIHNKDKVTAKATKSQLIFYLHDIRSGFNVGSMIRLADGFNIAQVVLSGYTAGVDNSQVARASLGAELNIKCVQDNEYEYLLQLKSKGYQVIALETVVDSTSLVDFNFPEKTVLIVGNERSGLKQTTLALADELVHIPLYGTKNSLNVSTALSIASYEWTKQWR